MAIAELVTKFLFKGSLKPLEEYNVGLGTAVKGLSIFSTAAFTSAAALSAFVVSSAEAAESQISLSKQTSLSVEKIRELSYVAGQFGISASTAESSISSLNKKIGEAAISGSEVFSRLGISVRDMKGDTKDVATVLEDVRKRFRTANFSLQQKVSFTDSLGLDSRFIEVLDLSDSKFKDMIRTIRSFGVVTEKQAEALEHINQNTATWHAGLKALRTQIAVQLAPAFEEMTKGFSSFIKNHSRDIARFFKHFADLVVSAAGAIKRLAPVIGIAIGLFTAWKIASIGLGAALDFALAPVVLITAGITAAVLIVDDLIVAFEGGNSVIATMFKKLTGLDLSPFLQKIVYVAKNALPLFYEAVSKVITKVEKVFLNFFDRIGEKFKVFKTWGNDVKRFFGFSTTPVLTAAQKKDKLQADQLAKVPLPTWGLSSNIGRGSNTTHVTQQVNIDVKSTDPHKAAAEIKSQLNDHLRYTQSQFAVGGV